MNNERFTVEVIEIRSRLVTVCADSEDSAINQVKKRYNKGQIDPCRQSRIYKLGRF